MMNANSNVICTAKYDDVGKVSVAFLLSTRMRIPIFQRRYCWGRDQWATLLGDALSVVDGAKAKHVLGRITCVKGDPQKDSRLAVIDGQQRNTTCSLLLAAIRDVAASRGSDAACQSLSMDLDSVLLPDAGGFESWLFDRSGADLGAGASTMIEEGEALDFAALIPTYCDRSSYFAAVLPPRSLAKAAAGEWQRPMEAKLYFFEEIMAYSADRLQALADVVLHKLEWLFFPICVWDGHRDGTEDLNIIYERLALRDATFCKPTRDTEFASMGSADFVRNLLLGSFHCEPDAIEMYKRHWLPIEKAAAEAARQSHTSGVAAILERMLDAFLKAQPEESLGPAALHSGAVGGQIYARFRRWFAAAIPQVDTESEDLCGSELEGDELKTVALLKRLQGFAIPHFLTARSTALDNGQLPRTNHASAFGKPPQPGLVSHLLWPSSRRAVPQPGVSGSKWRCPQCQFMSVQGTHCTACLLAKPEA